MKVSKVIVTLLNGLPETLSLLIASFFFASLIGLGMAWLYLRKNPILSALAKFYLGIVRGTPPLLMLLLSYFGLPKLFTLVGININDWAKIFFGIVGLSIGWGAYLEEAFRSAYLSVDKGQYEAALSVGMDAKHAFFQILMPQTFLIALPNIENLLIGLVKATSLVYVMGMVDMYSEATDLSNQNQGIYQLEIFIILALLYWLIVLLIEWVFRMFHRYYRYVEI
ncbi:amino acid ABC transporter permease [Loigolactobacillus backii]|uniref:Amino acid ABC transporter permease n=1 Tax=Loigolactobacillus backii TaxID=375175 RepID=A0A192H1V7_9LACO|nr:amino acid ABC transporter permease [Loigolactobacillus backii]ANK60336.1 amino acid ABC transporter permease [Loigolactobacillus backii]ANK62222.1 amino acid ABC transporter permease [Loigolactobacillus backii]ANK65217.1 amino acid ABC transporter permease [Loigolactobacillus backii]ANK67775.1 amino acid ABC transporter permease [Loigolactobacillus backii]ANK70763.1 amino acid ABC transporter permease [Loigolactobacillus backii]